MGDDGFAQHVLEFMENNKNKLFNTYSDVNVDLIDIGTAGLSMAKILEDYDAVIFIDAIRMGNKPGEIYEFEIKIDDIPKKMDISFSFHDSKIEELISFSKSINSLPDKVFIIGCEPKEISLGIELSDELKLKVKSVVERIFKIISTISN